MPVLLTTGISLGDDARQLLELGARGFLAKPYDIVSLSQAIARVLRPVREAARS